MLVQSAVDPGQEINTAANNVIDWWVGRMLLIGQLAYPGVEFLLFPIFICFIFFRRCHLPNKVIKLNSH